MDTIHRDLLKKKKYKNFKIFLVCDLIYGIFILRLLKNALMWYVEIFFSFPVYE